MQKNIFLYIIGICCLLATGACQEEEYAQGQGTIQLVLTDGEAMDTRALPSLSDELVGQFKVIVYSLVEKKIAFSGTCNELNLKQPNFKPGDYTIQAFFGDNPVLALDAPYYESELKTITVEKGKAQTVTLTCTVANAMASFQFLNTDKLDKVLKDYYVEIISEGQTVTWKPGDTANPYFKAGNKVMFYLKGTWIESNQPYSLSFATVQPVEAARNYIYKLKVDTSNMTGATFDIQVDAQVETVTVNETVPQAWLPKPKVTAIGFDDAKLLTYTETADNVVATISYEAVRPVQDVEFTLNFQDPNFTALNGTYLLSTLTAEQRAGLQAANISLPTIDGVSANGYIVINTENLLTVDGGGDTDNQMIVKVKANDRWSDEAVYTVKTVKPKFTIDVKDGNCWTKEFTIEECMVSTGNADKIKADLVYQFSEDGGATWQNCNNDRKQLFATEPTVKAYKVRALYRGIIASEVKDATLETPTQLPNSGMEEWDTSTSKRKTKMYNPWATGGIKFWDTDNQYTTRYSVIPSLWNNFPAVSFTRISNSGTFAAELRNTGAGPGGLKGTMQDYARAPGMLFIGNYTGTDNSGGLSSGTFTYDKGRAFSVRPTSLKFYCTYTPQGSDKFRVAVFVYDKNGKTIGDGELVEGGTISSYTDKTISINYDKYATNGYIEPAATIYVVFLSTNETNQGSIPCTKNVSVTLGDEGSKQTHAGSVLRIDDISLSYDK